MPAQVQVQVQVPAQALWEVVRVLLRLLGDSALPDDAAWVLTGVLYIGVGSLGAQGGIQVPRAACGLAPRWGLSG